MQIKKTMILMSHSVPTCPKNYKKCPKEIYNVSECHFSTEDASYLLRMQYKTEDAKIPKKICWCLTVSQLSQKI